MLLFFFGICKLYPLKYKRNTQYSRYNGRALYLLMSITET